MGGENLWVEDAVPGFKLQSVGFGACASGFRV